MATTGATAPGTARSDTTVGAVAWTNPTNVLTSNDARATAVLNNQQSNYLFAFDFGFAVPENATITGFTVSLERSKTAGTGNIRDTAIYLVKRGRLQPSGTNKADTATNWPGTDAAVSYGASDDLWGGVWTPADVNSPQFGIIISVSEVSSASATAGIDYLSINIAYDVGYSSAPQVQEPGQIFLFGKHYPLAPEEGGGAGRVRTVLATQFPPKIVTNADYGRSSNPVVSTYSVDDLRGGMGLWRYSKYLPDGSIHPEQANRFWTSTSGAETRGPQAITLPPLVVDAGRPGTETGVLRSHADYEEVNTATFNFGAAVYNLTGVATWSGLIDTLPTIPIDTVNFNGRLFYALAGSGYSYRSAATGAATDVATPTFVAFAVWDNKIYGLDVSDRPILYSSTTGNSGSWTTLATMPEVSGTTISALFRPELLVHDDAGGEPILYARLPGSLWAYDAVNDKWFKTRISFPRWGRANWQEADRTAVYDGVLYAAIGNTVYKYDIANRELSSIGWDRDDGVPASLAGDIDSFSADINDLYAFGGYAHGVGTAETGEVPTVVAYNGKGWHILYPVPAPDDASAYVGSRVFVSSTVGYRLYFTRRANIDEYHALYFNLGPTKRIPLQSTVRDYAAAGNVILPYYDGGTPEQMKTAQQVRIKVAGATVNETVQVAYRINGSAGSFTNLGSTVTVDDEVILPFGSVANGFTGLTFKSIQFQLTLARGTTTTLAPKIEYFALDFVRKPDVLRGYTVNLDLSRTYQNRSPQQMVDALWGAMGSSLFGTFAWHDDAGNVRSSLVMVLKPDGIEHTGRDPGSTYQLTLIEMMPN